MVNRVHTKKLESGEVVAYSDTALRHNGSAVEYCRTSMAALSGISAGIQGLTGLIGFGFYFVSVLVFWGLLLLKAGSQWNKYFVNRKSLLTNGFMGGLCTFVLFWTFLYGMVHVY